jgi:hypothetical protein
LQLDQAKLGVEATEVTGIGRDHHLAASARADDDVGVGNVSGAAGSPRRPS